MPEFRIPDDLVTLVAEQRLIPFVGAGFSAAHGLPTWDSLLREVAREVQAGAENQPQLDYDQIKRSCEGDNLRIAEYLYLMSGGSIGPVRHSISNAVRTETPLVNSTPHIELVNLGAPQVYTTNFEDLIERTYRELGLDVDVVALPRDVARSHANRTQVVKYHGDLRHDDTLVLTESQYYNRLEFESPMDLKFRSDLLGRSVLFIGYSFSDINIRVIWFKLMQMMEDVPQKDRPPSYIVQLHPNRVLDTLYEAVGLRTIVIDPNEEANSGAEQSSLLAEFMLELSMKAASVRGNSAAGNCPSFVSRGLLAAIESEIGEPGNVAGRSRSRLRRLTWVGSGLSSSRLVTLAAEFNAREIPTGLLDESRNVFEQLAENSGQFNEAPVIDLAIRFASRYGGSPGATFTIAKALTSEKPRDLVLGSDVRWDAVWQQTLDVEQASALVDLIDTEVDGHFDDVDPYRDHDLAYAMDIAHRVVRGGLVAGDGSEVVQKAEQLIARATELYPAVADYVPPDDAVPNPAAIAKQIDQLEQQEAQHEDEEEGDVE